MLECNIIHWLYRCFMFSIQCQDLYYKQNNLYGKNVGINPKLPKLKIYFDGNECFGKC